MTNLTHAAIGITPQDRTFRRTARTLVFAFLAALQVPLLVANSSVVQAKEESPNSFLKDWKRYGIVEHWYEPAPGTSVDDAARTIIDFQRFFVDTRNKPIERILVRRDGIAVFTSATQMVTEEHWAPVSGGSWVGTQYVPYYGGSTVVTQRPVTYESEYWLTLKTLSAIKIRYMRDEGTGHEWSVVFFDENNAAKIALWTGDRDVARRFADAVATLAAQESEGFLSNQSLSMGDFGEWNNAKRFRKLKWKGASGYLIDALATGGPGDRGGLQKDDIIFEIDGAPVTDYPGYVDALVGALRSRPAATVTLSVFRARKVIPVKITLPNLVYAYRQTLSAAPTAPGAPPAKYFGTTSRPLTLEEIQRAGLEEGQGVFIDHVYEGSAADRLGVEAGDFLLEANGTAIDGEDAIVGVRDKGEITRARVWRNGAVVELPRSRSAPSTG